MRAVCLIAAFALTIPVAEAGDVCEPTMLRPPVLTLIKPLVELRIKQNEDQFTEDGRWKGESRHTPEIERRLENLLNDRSRTGDEALAYLLNVYMGEHAGEELVCEVTNRGKRMLSLIASYAKCTPLTGLEPLPKFVRGSGALPDMAKKGILSGKRCEYEK
jgi:hypothetical protein